MGGDGFPGEDRGVIPIGNPMDVRFKVCMIGQGDTTSVQPLQLLPFSLLDFCITAKPLAQVLGPVIHLDDPPKCLCLGTSRTLGHPIEPADDVLLLLIHASDSSFDSHARKSTASSAFPFFSFCFPSIPPLIDNADKLIRHT
ncbi:hypothetical protein DsansV1_C13g0127571 [Dioscorea sansibarensis]